MIVISLRTLYTNRSLKAVVSRFFMPEVFLFQSKDKMKRGSRRGCVRLKVKLQNRLIAGIDSLIKLL